MTFFTAGNIIEENHYYSFGLKIAAISSKKMGNTAEGVLKNDFLYNDKELYDDGDLNWYDYGFRNYDPQTGRFVQQDPLAEAYSFSTPYSYAGNDPIANIDYLGLAPVGEIISAASTLSTTADKAITLSEIVITGTKVVKSSFSWAGAMSKIGSALKTAADVITDVAPIVGSAKDIYYGIKDGNGWQVAAGVVGVAADVFTFGAASVVKGGIKVAAKQAIKSGVVDDIARLAKKVVKHAPCGCFIAGTLVLTTEGYASIENIKPGDVVWAYNDTTGVYGAKKVINVFEYTRDTVYQVQSGAETIHATSDHPFFIGGQWLKVADLQVGDSVQTYEGGKIAISAINVVAGSTTVYNFEVEDYHTYYVSQAKVLVHNSGPCPHTTKTAKGVSNIAKNAKKMSPDDIGKFLNAGKDWHKSSAKGNFLKQFKKELKGDTNADFYIDKTTREVFLKSNKSGNWINTGQKFD